MSQTYEAPAVIDEALASAEPNAETAVDVFISPLEGYSEEEINAATAELNDLWAVVEANAGTIVYCSRLGGAKLPLGEAVNTIWPISDKGAMVKEGPSSVRAEIQRMLDNPAEEIEQGEEEPEEEIPEKAEQAKDAEEADKPGEREVLKNEPDKPEEEQVVQTTETDQKDIQAEAEQSADKVDKSAADHNNVVSATKIEAAKFAQKESSQPVKVTAKAEAGSSNSSADIISVDSTGTREMPADVVGSSGSTAPESITKDPPEGFMVAAPALDERLSNTKFVVKTEDQAKQRDQINKVSEADITTGSVVEVDMAPEEPELPADHGQKPPVLPRGGEATVEYESMDLAPEAETVTTFDDSLDPAEEVESAEEESDLAELDYQITVAEPVDFGGEEFIIIDHLGEADMELQAPSEYVEGYFSEEESPPPRIGEFDLPERTIKPEKLVQINFAIEEAEDCLTKLAERMETGQPEIVETINKILDEIIELPAKIELSRGENISVEAEAEEELEELFTELLDKAGIDYTPELIKSLTYLTLKWNLADEIEKIKKEEEIDEPIQDVGTHEIIKKLLSGLSTIKKAVAHACTIGRSVLRLYSFNAV